ncbi:MAG TPA: hypothetical protein VKX25_10425 [Bryobacteraceae bacterium]|nr:hypothetical protein [Bryobacteraceae bacterium]
MEISHKYARIERERRFLVAQLPCPKTAHPTRRIIDRYIEQTRLRLRRQVDSAGATTFKLTQKIPAQASGAQQGLITTMYLDAGEYRIFARLPAKEIRKTRYSVPPFGIDVFEGPIAGLILAEAEFESPAEAESLVIPPFIVCEVSDDIRFTGGRLVHASPQDIRNWLADYNLELSQSFHVG